MNRNVKLQDAQWQELEPILLGHPTQPGIHAKNNRLFIDAILCVVSTGVLWSRLPLEFGNWRTAYMRFRRWTASGFWQYLARSKIQDRTLRLLLERVANYGDLYLQIRSRTTGKGCVDGVENRRGKLKKKKSVDNASMPDSPMKPAKMA
jgi:transposase